MPCKKPILLFTALLALGLCGAAQTPCVLDELPKTTDYQRYLKEYIEAYKRDTLITLEQKTINDTAYSTEFDIRANEAFAWIDVTPAGGTTRRILIHRDDFEDDFEAIHTSFDTKKCDLSIRTRIYDLETDEYNNSTQRLHLPSPANDEPIPPR